jgi:hypothetical protein
MLLTQVAGGFAVICDEGLGRQIMEIFPQICCDSTRDDTPSSPAGDQDQGPCGPCVDVPLVPFHLVDDELQSSFQRELALVATLPDTPLTQLLGCGTTARSTTPRATSSTTVAQFIGSVVMLC